ncbi:hypothetical protein OC846_001988 [Tilletia horrida]|uniref:HCP-like protein n=1 Tax=Tilletia horrida TaxID=155126 RepID=A0AAN6GRY4_9BASI|nr:hypothetical protein OC846_001988 [Tilletia horrida]KAK0555426.1 hypothetical protein OC845_000298 [Tilletia horrida]KAK0568818.1 hypothetical protein OC861_001595 [Tilletia horrida]
MQPQPQQPQQQQHPQHYQYRQHLLAHAYPSQDGPLSPLDALVRNGKNARREARNPSNAGPNNRINQSGRPPNDILSRATSLSRSTSIRTAHPTVVTDDQENESISHDVGSSSSSSGTTSLSKSSFSSLGRRDSVDTVRSSEFGDDGRWARAWTKRPDDEESIFDDGASSQWDAQSARSVSISWDPTKPVSDEEEYRQARSALQDSSISVDPQVKVDNSARPLEESLLHSQVNLKSRPPDQTFAPQVRSSASSAGQIQALSSASFPSTAAPVGLSKGPPPPLAPANILNQAAAGNHFIAPTSPPGSHLRSPRGHPAGRPPPPPPSSYNDYSPSGRPISGRYEDPNTNNTNPYVSQQDWTASLGRHRAAVLAAHDGRASLVSDLDVETLRLDGSSSRRSSTSTIRLDYSASNPRSLHPPGSPQLSSPKRRSAETWRGRLSSEMQRANAAQAVAQYEQQETALLKHENGHRDLADRHVSISHQKPRAIPQRSASQDDYASTTSDSYSNFPSSQSFANTAGSSSHSNIKPNGALSVNSHASSSRPPPPPPPPIPKAAPKPVSTAEELLSRGIEYHEAGDLSRSVFYLERSAKVEGGCVVGMCMYGMALREGWGAKKDPRRGFEWIQAAATRAGELLKVNQPRTEAEINALKSELKLSVYELGKCYCYGWGVKMDKRMALEYFELAAKLGDADAQAEAGALYATGKGCKKDLRTAARYYRMAEAQGYDTVGLSWIHKEKYL